MVDPGDQGYAAAGDRGRCDDISGIGQTKAALDLATGLAASKKQYHLAKDVGHYGIFNGRKWREKIAPVVERFIAANGWGRSISDFWSPIQALVESRAGGSRSCPPAGLPEAASP